MMELERFKLKLSEFPFNYMRDFDGFWKWKLQVETSGAHVLDEVYRGITYHKLRDVLARWQTYRSSRNLDPWETLKRSLEVVSDAYSQLRMFNLLEFNKIPVDLLETIWHELGRVKEYKGVRNSAGCYYIISICKPLMLLWGQTLAFDSRVRANIPDRYNIPKGNRWTFNEWHKVMRRFQEELLENLEIVRYFKAESLRKYGSDFSVPYGRFLDIYYF